MDRQVPAEVMDERLQRLQAVLNRDQAAFNAARVGRTCDVLIERAGKLPGQMLGKSPWLQSVHVMCAAQVGDLVRVELTGGRSELANGSRIVIGRRTLIGGTLTFAATPAFARVSSAIAVGPSRAMTTVGAALAEARTRGRPTRIVLDDGVYAEKLLIDVPDVTIEGRGAGAVLSWADSNGTLRPGGGTWGTSGSASVTVTAPGVALVGLTIRNAYDFVAARAATPPRTGLQAVALLVDRGADRTIVARCRLEGYQDTFYVQPRAHIVDSTILGGTDFIFGGGAALFERCRIVTRFVPGADGQGYVAAPSTPADHPFGLVFDRCRLEREAGVPDGSAWLGRPWRAGGNMTLTGSATFLRCWMDAHIRDGGWTAMGYRGPDGAQRMLTRHEARLSEYASAGPGAAGGGPDRRILTSVEAAAYTRAAVLDGWRGAT